MSTPLLQASNISHSFDIQLYDNVNLVLKSSTSTAILGRSGSGKSTLLHHFSSFLKPQQGEVILLGHDIYKINESDIEELRRRDIGIIFQFHYLFKGMSALQNIQIATILAREQIDEALLERLGIANLMEQKISELSGGEQQRVSIARVLSKHPRVIFADEPTGNLDKETANLVMDVLLEYIEQKHATLLLVTHDEEMAKRCDATYKLADKKLEQIDAF